MMIVPVVEGVAALIAGVGGGYYLGVFTGAHYIPTSRADVERILALAELKPNEKLVDIGSGDGRIVIAAAKAGTTAHGYEINPLLVWWSRYLIRKAGVYDRVTVTTANFWHKNLKEFDVVVVFGIPHIMKKLEEKLGRELCPGARVISNVFAFPTWKGEWMGSLYRYVKKNNHKD